MSCGQFQSAHVNKEIGYRVTDSGKIMHWPQNSEIGLSFEEDFPLEAKQAIESSYSIYNNNLENISLQTNNYSVAKFQGNKSFSGTNTVHWISQDQAWPFEDKHPTASAVTISYYNQDGIYGTKLFFRESKLNYAKSSINKSLFFAFLQKKENILAQAASIETGLKLNFKTIEALAGHELGHSLGLVHSDDKEALMYPDIERAQINRTEKLNHEDKERLARAYLLK